MQAPTPFGRYVLLEKIAVGGMAEIFKAQYKADKDFEKVVVIKRILPHLVNNEEFITMFRDEAKVNVKLTHANIVQVFDFGRLGDDYYLAMEYVQGQNLRRVMKRAAELGNPALPLAFSLYVALESAKGLAYAHTRKDNAGEELNIIHRDVTPSNLLVSYEGEVKITDFGIAKAASKTGSTQQGMVKGKAPYLAPEQLKPAGSPDARLDIFALGAVTWEMLTGRRLIPGETDVETIGCILATKQFAPPSSVKANIPPDVDKVILKALEVDPANRYPTAAAYAKDLAVLAARFAITSADIASFMSRLFQDDIDAEAERSKNLQMSVVDAGAVAQGAEQEATRTRRSVPLAATEPTGAALLRDRSESGTRTALTPSKPHRASTPLAPAPPKSSGRGAMLGVSALVLAAAAAGAWTQRDLLFGSGSHDAVFITPDDTSVPIALATATMTPEPSEAPPRATATAKAVRTPVKVAVATPRETPRVTAEPPAPTPVAPAVTGRGIVSIDSEPWGEIFIDGKPSGRETPAFDLEVPAGRHEIRIVNPVSKLETRFIVDVKPDQTIKKGKLPLAPRK